jgi:Suppressor of fused protein (SUFU)
VDGSAATVRSALTAYHPPAALSTNLQGCSAYNAGDHWHYVTYGLSTLYEPDADDDPEVSGWGFELTLRLPRATDTGAPTWPFTMLNELAKHVNSNLVLLEAGHRVDLNAPITGSPHTPDGPPTGLSVLALTVDPRLGSIDTPNGRVTFLQVVGVTAAEKERMLEASTSAVLDELRVGNPWLTTDPERA